MLGRLELIRLFLLSVGRLPTGQWSSWCMRGPSFGCILTTCLMDLAAASSRSPASPTSTMPIATGYVSLQFISLNQSDHVPIATGMCLSSLFPPHLVQWKVQSNGLTNKVTNHKKIGHSESAKPFLNSFLALFDGQTFGIWLSCWISCLILSNRYMFVPFSDFIWNLDISFHWVRYIPVWRQSKFSWLFSLWI